VVGFKGVPSSSRLTLSRDEFESLRSVKRGDFGCLVSCPSSCESPFVCTSRTAGTGSAFSCVCGEDDLCLVKDRVLSVEAGLVGSAEVVSFASSNVSYQVILLACFLRAQMQAMCRVTLAEHRQGRIATYILPV